MSGDFMEKTKGWRDALNKKAEESGFYESEEFSKIHAGVVKRVKELQMTDTKTHRQLWISEHGGGSSLHWDGPPNYTESYYLEGNKVFYVVEISALLAEQEKVENLKARLSVFEGRTYSENDEITKLKEANKVLRDAVEFCVMTDKNNCILCDDHFRQPWYEEMKEDGKFLEAKVQATHEVGKKAREALSKVEALLGADKIMGDEK